MTKTAKTRKAPTRRAKGASIINADARAKMAAREPDAVSEALSEFRGEPDRLRAFAEAHGAWREGYEKLNPGQQRMNVGNRLRAMLRAGTITTLRVAKRRSRKRIDA
jgi:hypothetical protein